MSVELREFQISQCPVFGIILVFKVAAFHSIGFFMLSCVDQRVLLYIVPDTSFRDVIGDS